MVSDDFIPSKTGVGVHLRFICEELVRRGHAVSLITSRRKGQPARETWRGVGVHRMFSVTWNHFRLATPSRSALRRVLQEHEPDIVHYHYAGFLLHQTMAAARSMPVRHVYTYHMTVEHLVQDSRFLKLFAGPLQRAITGTCNRCDLVTAPSRELARRIAADGVRTPTQYLSSAAGIEIFQTTTARPTGKFVVLYVGRLNPEKNVAFLLRGFKLLRDRCPETELWIVGDGPQRRQLTQCAEELGITAATRFHGHVNHEDLADYYAAADAFVLPSLVETQGLSVIEAMHFGKPVIVTDAIVSAEELVQDGLNGFVVPRGSVEGLAARLEGLCRDAETRERMGRQSGLHSAQYTTPRIVDELEQLYLRVLRNDPADLCAEIEADEGAKKAAPELGAARKAG
jgi:1,2-diacylglycerol 3-alpha-glucosyltransferase